MDTSKLKRFAPECRTQLIEQVGVKLEERMLKLQADAAGLERAGKPVPPKLQQQIEGIQVQLRENRDEISARRSEMVTVQERFRVDLARYRELKGAN